MWLAVPAVVVPNGSRHGEPARARRGKSLRASSLSGLAYWPIIGAMTGLSASIFHFTGVTQS